MALTRRPFTCPGGVWSRSGLISVILVFSHKWRWVLGSINCVKVLKWKKSLLSLFEHFRYQYTRTRCMYKCTWIRVRIDAVVLEMCLEELCSLKPSRCTFSHESQSALSWCDSQPSWLGFLCTPPAGMRVAHTLHCFLWPCTFWHVLRDVSVGGESELPWALHC